MLLVVGRAGGGFENEEKDEEVLKLVYLLMLLLLWWVSNWNEASCLIGCVLCLNGSNYVWVVSGGFGRSDREYCARDTTAYTYPQHSQTIDG